MNTKSLLASYENHMTSHPGTFVALPSHCPATLLVATAAGTLQVTGTAAGMQIMLETSSGCTKSARPLGTQAELDTLISMIGAANMEIINEDIRCCRQSIAAISDARKSHGATLKCWIARRLQILAELSDATAHITTEWVRQGKVSPGHCSFNYRDQFREAGCSVFPAKRIGGVLYILEFCAASMFFVPDFVVAGTQVGTGSDGEPLVDATACRKSRKGEIVMM